jgi:hypothetical protein
MTKLRASLFILVLAAPLLARADEAPPPDAPKADAPKADAPKADAPKADAPKPDKEGFVPVQPNETLSPSETLPGNGLVGAAYGFILAAMVVWIASVAVRARRVEEELEALRAKIERGAKQA